MIPEIKYPELKYLLKISRYLLFITDGPSKCVEISLTLVPASALESGHKQPCLCQRLNFPFQSNCYARVLLPGQDSQLAKTIGQWVGTSDREFPFLTADKALPMLADHSQSGQQGIPFESNIWNPFQLTSCMAKHLGTVNNWKCRTERIKGQPRDLCVVQFNFDANFHLALSKGDGCDAEWARYTPQR